MTPLKLRSQQADLPTAFKIITGKLVLQKTPDCTGIHLKSDTHDSGPMT